MVIARTCQRHGRSVVQTHYHETTHVAYKRKKRDYQVLLDSISFSLSISFYLTVLFHYTDDGT